MKKITQIIIAGLLVTVLAACHEGPAEKEGKKIDNAVENVQDKLQNKGPAQKAGEKLDELNDN